MAENLSRIESDLEMMKRAAGMGRPLPDSPVPHLLLAGAGVVCGLLAWGLEVMGSARFPLIAALLLGVPPLMAMIIWGRLKAGDPAYAGVARKVRGRREFWWQMIATGSLVGVMVASGLSLISAPVLLTLLVILVFALLNGPMVERQGYSSIGWCMSIGLLGVWMLFSLPVPGPRGMVLGVTLVLGGLLAAGIAVLVRKWSGR